MKKTITLRLCIVIAVSMLVSALICYYLQVKSVREAAYDGAVLRINQISELLEKNDAEVERLKENLKEDYIIRAQAAAYIVQNNPGVDGNLEELKKIADLLQVDELHLFDPEGTLYSGSEPQYYNYTFDSGEQMRFFLPLLDDYSLKLCQEVTPNTAEKKLMQYVAVWREDRNGIIQIGMKPTRLLEAMKKNELSHLFTMLTFEEGITAFAADPKSGIVIGSTDSGLAGLTLEDMGISLSGGEVLEKGFSTELMGEKNYCVLLESGQVLIGVCDTYKSLYRTVPANMWFVVVSLCILSVIIILLILRMLDRSVIHGINEIIRELRQIADGDLDARVEVADSPEFVELSSNINDMVKSLLEMTGKMSLVFRHVNVPIAVYEYNHDMKRVLATSKIGEILRLSDEEIQRILSSRELFCEKIKEITKNTFDEVRDVYLICTDKVHYVKMMSYQEGHKTLGIIVDVTEDVVEKQQIKLERDIDLLTGLYSRRAFFSRMERLFNTPAILKTTMFLMVDLDNLKYVNDSWGHENGDRLLQISAKLLNQCVAPEKIVSRLSGDEFVVVIYGADSQEEILGYLDRLCEQIRESVIYMPGDEPVQVRLSGGYVFYPEVLEGYRTLLHLADQTMYQAKKNGKGHFERYIPDSEDTAGKKQF